MAHPKRLDADVVLLDIEGTISPISFVKDVLFAYSRERLTSFVEARRDDPVVRDSLAQASVLANGGDPIPALNDWQDRDVKAPPLKKLQGLIWADGYRLGAFRSSLFPDALDAIRRWHAAGVPLYIYSSGSVQAQLLFFQFSTAGDLRSLFSGHYDTDIGSKADAESYARIARDVDAVPQRIVFFSDSANELHAARQAGLQACAVAKDGAQPAGDFPAVFDFGDVEIVHPRQAAAPAGQLLDFT